MILIIGATELELKKLKKLYHNVFITGIGITNTAYNLTKIIYSNRNKIKKIFMLGIGGGFKNKINLLDICIATKEINADFGIFLNGKIDKIDKNTVDLENSKYLNCIECKKGTFITVNCVTTDKKLLTFYEQEYSPICENMEGFAAAYICEKEKIDFYEIRVISNFVGERKNWKVKEAVDILYDVGKSIIKKFT